MAEQVNRTNEQEQDLKQILKVRRDKLKALQDAGIVKKTYDGVKFLGRGEVTKKLTVKAAAFSEGAKSKIEAAGGKAEVV